MPEGINFLNAVKSVIYRSIIIRRHICSNCFTHNSSYERVAEYQNYLCDKIISTIHSALLLNAHHYREPGPSGYTQIPWHKLPQKIRSKQIHLHTARRLQFYGVPYRLVYRVPLCYHNKGWFCINYSGVFFTLHWSHPFVDLQLHGENRKWTPEWEKCSLLLFYKCLRGYCHRYTIIVRP